MATRFYFPSSGSAPVNPEFSAEWEHQRNARLPLVTTAGSSPLTDVLYEPDAAEHIADQDSLFAQFVSPPMEAQTIAAQTVNWQFQAAEANTACNLFVAITIFTVSNAGTVKESVLAIKRDGTEVSSILVAVTNRSDTATSTEVAVDEGDRLVIELGLGGLPTTGGFHNGTIRIGEAAIGDLPAGNTQVDTNLRPWLEFADSTISFLAPSNLLPMMGVGQ